MTMMARRTLVWTLLLVLSAVAASQVDEAVVVEETTPTNTTETPLSTKEEPEATTVDGELEIGEEVPIDQVPMDDIAEEKLAATEESPIDNQVPQTPVQVGPFIDLLGPQLLSLEMLSETQAQLQPHYTNEVLKDKKVVGLYFSADWCGPCRKFTPELVSFYQKMNQRKGRQNQFEIVWVSRCRDVQSFGQYFTQMGGWLALPPEQAMGQRGQMLSEKYKVKSIPTLVLLDDLGNTITTDARNKIPTDKAGIGFPWRNPLATFYMTILPKSIRLMLRSQVTGVKDKMLSRVKQVLGLQRG